MSITEATCITNREATFVIDTTATFSLKISKTLTLILFKMIFIWQFFNNSNIFRLKKFLYLQNIQ